MYGFSSSKVLVSEETLVFSGLSLFAELGGALGLFIGFSLLGLYEHLVDLFRFLRSNYYSNSNIK